MPLTALILVISASLFHIAWNTLLKKAPQKLAFIWLALFPPSIMGCGLFFWQVHSFPPEGIYCLFASGIIHGFYIWSLAQAYNKADLSFVYPYCRGIGTALAAALGILFLNETPSFMGGTGVGLILLAIFWEPLTRRKQKEKTSLTALLFALFNGICVGSYLIVDKIGVEHISPPIYLCVMLFFTQLALVPIIFQIRKQVQEQWKLGKKQVLAAAFCMSLSYGVTLAAMKIAPIMYVASARSSAIVVSGITGWLVLREEISSQRWVAIGMIAVGVYCLGVA